MEWDLKNIILACVYKYNHLNAILRLSIFSDDGEKPRTRFHS